MRKLLLAAIVCIISIQCKTNKESKPTKNETSVNKTKKELVGGWTAVEANDTVKELASYVLETKQIDVPISKITNASSQIVSGKNYKFEMSLENGDHYMAQVYVNLKKEREIIKFEKLNQ